MDENPFVKQKSTWKPPDKRSNPYRRAKFVRQVVEVAPLVVPFPTSPFKPTVSNNPYFSAEEYQARTGVKLATKNNPLTDESSPKIAASNVEKEIVSKFIVKLNGIYLKPKNKLTEDERQLCNFSFVIIKQSRYLKIATEQRRVKSFITSQVQIWQIVTTNSTRKICRAYPKRISIKLLMRFYVNSKNAIFLRKINILREIISRNTELSSTENSDELTALKNFFRITAGTRRRQDGVFI